MKAIAMLIQAIFLLVTVQTAHVQYPPQSRVFLESFSLSTVYFILFCMTPIPSHPLASFQMNQMFSSLLQQMPLISVDC